jgi:hypothetical protein
MADSILFLHLPLLPGSKAAREAADAGQKNATSAIYFVRANEQGVTAGVKSYTEKLPKPGEKHMLRLPVLFEKKKPF